MSRGNVDAVRHSIDAYRAGDWEEATAYLAPDVVWEIGQELPARGPAAVREMWSRWNDEWERLDMIGEEIIDAGDKVFVAMHYRGRGASAGSPSTSGSSRCTPSVTPSASARSTSRHGPKPSKPRVSNAPYKSLKRTEAVFL